MDLSFLARTARCASPRHVSPARAAGMIPPARSAGMIPPARSAGMIPPARSAGMIPPARSAGMDHPPAPRYRMRVQGTAAA